MAKDPCSDDLSALARARQDQRLGKGHGVEHEQRYGILKIA
jgi:hypothetical protein